MPAPSPSEFLDNLPGYHPRVLIDRPETNKFRNRYVNTQEAKDIISEANRYIEMEPPRESDGIATIRNSDPKKQDKLDKDASKLLGGTVFNAVDPFLKAYLLTKDEKYAHAALKWAMEVASWDPEGVSRINDFGDSRAMLSMALVFDTLHDRLTDQQRRTLVDAVEKRASYFYNLWINSIESKIVSNHVWQHIFHYLFDTALAMHGEIPEAKNWLTYLYTLYLARTPVLGGDDGGWVHGLSYFRMNMAVLVDVPMVIKKYTGFDFIKHHPWYRENVNYFLYGFPPGSAGNGFADNAHDLPEPRGDYMAYADALARLTQSSHAAWYRDQVDSMLNDKVEPHVLAYMRPFRVKQGEKESRAKADIEAELAELDLSLEDASMLRWYRLKYLYDIPSAEPESPEVLPKARVFEGVGLVNMHSRNLSEYTEDNLMLAMRSSPYGTYSHMLSDNNTFNINYGGDRLFYHTGYKVAMNAPHRQKYYKHTRSHNGILINDEGQPYATEAFGWMERFLTGDIVSYAAGNASNAYRSVTEGEDTGLKHFRRHVLMLRPNMIVVYDELEADHTAEWSWLLHSYYEMNFDKSKRSVYSGNIYGKSQVSLFSSTETNWSVTDEYEIPAENWRGTTDAEGEPVEYNNNAWHFKAVSEPTKKARFLAIIQVTPRNTNGAFKVINNLGGGRYKAGEWEISAILDADKPARIDLINTSKGVAFSSGSDHLHLNGETFEGIFENTAKLVEIKKGIPYFQEGRMLIPDAAHKALNILKLDPRGLTFNEE